MRKGALKKKQRQLEELLLDRREALGELVLGMYVQNNWDDDLLARGSAEVAEVETELNELIAGKEPEGPSATEKDFPVTGEHRLPGYPETGEYTAEHAVPGTGEHTGEHALPESAEHEYPATGEYTAEHAVPDSAEHTIEHTAEHEVPAPAEEPKLSRAEKKAAKKAKKERERAEKEAARQAAAEAATEDPASAEPKTEVAGVPETASPAPAPSTTAPTPSAAAPTPSATAPTPSATAPTPSATAPTPSSADPAAPAKQAATSSDAGKSGAETGEAAAGPADQPGDRKPIEVPPPPAAPEPEPTDPLDILEKQITDNEAKAKTAIEAAKATSNADAQTELTAITREVESSRSELDESLAKAAAAIASAEEKASLAEARLLRETAASRESAAEWVRGQAAEIEADAALAAEMNEEQAGSGPSGEPDPVLSARVTSLEAELAAEKAAKDEALTKAAARLKEIEESARLAEARVEAAESAAAEVQAKARVAAPAQSGNSATEAQAREAAVDWLRGQISALRQEIASGDESGQNPGGK